MSEVPLPHASDLVYHYPLRLSERERAIAGAIARHHGVSLNLAIRYAIGWAGATMPDIPLPPDTPDTPDVPDEQTKIKMEKTP